MVSLWGYEVQALPLSANALAYFIASAIGFPLCGAKIIPGGKIFKPLIIAFYSNGQCFSAIERIL
jgi:hypothetical protein